MKHKKMLKSQNLIEIRKKIVRFPINMAVNFQPGNVENNKSV